MIDGDDDRSVSQNRNNHVDDAKCDLKTGNDVKGLSERTIAVCSGIIVFAKIKLEKIRNGRSVTAIGSIVLQRFYRRFN